MAVFFASIGLVRYAYSPLIPSMLEHEWISASQAGYLGTINFIGNLIGAICCAMFAKRFGAGNVCRVALLIGLVSVLCAAWKPEFGTAWNAEFWWLAFCRFLAGLTAAGGMILAPVIVTAGASPKLRGVLIGLIFAGGGFGVVLLSLLLPLFVSEGPSGGWMFTAALVAGCIVIAWPGLTKRQLSPSHKSDAAGQQIYSLRLWILLVAYSLAAAGCVPHSIYLSAYVHKELDQPLSFSTMVFAVYGFGVMFGGPVFGGIGSKLLGRWLSEMLAILLGLLAVLTVVMTDNVLLVVISGGVLGLSQMGLGAVNSHRTLQLAGTKAQASWWGYMTVGYNIGQAGGAFAMGWMIHISLGYIAGFWMGVICFSLALIIAALVRVPKPLRGT